MMHKSMIAMAGCAALLLAADASARQTPTPADQQFFEQHISEFVTLKPTHLTNPALAQVLAGDLFAIDVMVGDGSSKVLGAREGNDLVQVTLPSTTAPMPNLRKILKPGFALTTEEAAHQLQDALDVLYPVDRDDAAAKTIAHTGNRCTFVRGKFFEHLQGFVFTTDPSGAVTGVQYSLELPAA